MGAPIDELSDEELREALEEAYALYERTRKQLEKCQQAKLKGYEIIGSTG